MSHNTRKQLDTFFLCGPERLFSKRDKTVSLVFLDKNRKHYDVADTRKVREIVFPQHFSHVLLCHSVFYFCLETHARLFYSP